MENSINNWALQILAWMCVLKPRNRILKLLMECIYCAIIALILSLFVSVIVVGICANDSINFDMVFVWIAGLMEGIFVYLILINRENQNAMVDYILLAILYFDEYEKDKKKLGKLKNKIFLDGLHFSLLLLCILLWTISFLSILKIESIDIVAIACGMDMCGAYVIFIYGKRKKETKAQRQELIRGLICLVWMVIVCIRIHQYWSDATQVGLEDMLILLFSVIFTIPTIYEWLKNLPSKIIEPYKESVNNRKKNLLKKCYEKKEENIQKVTMVYYEIQIIIVNIVHKWKHGEKKKVIKFIAYIVLGVVLISGILWATIWISNLVKAAVNKGSEKITYLYSNLNSTIKDDLNKGIVIFFLIVFVMLLGGRIPYVCMEEKTKIQKIKDIFVIMLTMTIVGRMIFFVWG